jgi:uncharacterized protein (DUF2141 family)
MQMNRTWVRSLLIGAATSLINFPVSAEQSSVTVNIGGLHSQKGNVMICLWRQQDKNFPVCSNTVSFQHLTVPVAGSISATFQNVSPGEYAITAFHDENQNGKLDRDFIGKPKEGIAFSNMSQADQGRPSFDKTKFTVNGAKTISSTMLYL